MMYRSIYSLIVLALLVGGCASTPDASNESDVLSTLGHSSSGEQPLDSVAVLLADGDDAFNAGDLDTAQVKYSLALSEDEKNTDALYKLAQIHYITKSYPIAITLLERVLIEDSDSAGALETLGLISLKSENYVDAELRFNQVLSNDPDRWRSLNALGVIFDVQSQHVDAQNRFKEALTFVPGSAMVINNLGYSYYLQGNYGEAQRQFLKSTRLDASYAKAWSNLGLTFVRQRRFDQARAAFGKVVEPHVAANNLGYLSMLQGDLSTSRHELETAVRVAPQYYSLANENLSLLQHQNSTNPSSTQSLVEKTTYQNDVDMVIIPASAKTEPLDQELVAMLSETSETDLTRPVKKAAVVSDASLVADKNPRAASTSLKGTDYLEFLGYGNLTELDASDNSIYYATISFQANSGLQPTGSIGPETTRLLQSLAQQRLKENLNARGYLNSIDTVANADVKQAVFAFEQDNGLTADGLVDRNVLKWLAE